MYYTEIITDEHYQTAAENGIKKSERQQSRTQLWKAERT